MACNTANEQAGMEKEGQGRMSLDSVSDSLVSTDSLHPSMDSVSHIRQDSPVKALPEPGGDPMRQGRKPPPSGWQLGAPNDIIPSLARNEGIPVCKRAFSTIRDSWSRDQASGLFRASGDSTSGLRVELPNMHDCLYCLPQADIQSLFGKPSRVVGSEMHYYLDKSCLGKGGMKSPGCECLVVELAATKVAKKVAIVKNLP